MTRHSPAAALSGAATFASLFLAGMTGAYADQPITEAVILADTDHDGVPDPQDNCPRRQNLEQFDSDQDGRGNDCDVTLGLAGVDVSKAIELYLLASATHESFGIGQLINNGNAPIQWHMSTDADHFDPFPSGTLSPGQSVPLVLSVDATAIPHGQTYHDAVRVDYGDESAVIEIILTIESDPPAELCEYEVALYKVKVTEDQNSAGDGCCGGNKLEIEAIDQINNATADWPSNGGEVDMKEGDSQVPNSVFYTDSVPVGETVTLPLYNKVIEHDSGANGADDWGDKEGEIEFVCSGDGFVDKTLTVSLTHNGNGNGKIKITTRATWSE